MSLADAVSSRSYNNLQVIASGLCCFAQMPINQRIDFFANVVFVSIAMLALQIFNLFVVEITSI
jgi:hypothetical protein